LSPKQGAFIAAYLQLEKQFKNKKWPVSDLLKQIDFTRAIFNNLVNKGIFSVEKESISRLLKSNEDLIENKELADFQKIALDQIKASFKQKDVCLLHGVTSSGKTELYIKLIEEQLSKGKQVLYLLPEIALTTQIIKRLQKHFGNKVGITHSHLNNSERVEIWKAVQEQDSGQVQYPVMLGARSALFLPFDNLGLIIVDEEHDSSFKQHQSSPRYHARDGAIYLAHLHQSKVVLGSATPSVESYYNAKIDKYGLVEMHSRFEGIALPKIQTIDIRKAHLKKQMTYQFAPKMLSAIEKTLNLGKQVILFQNRRGYSPVLSCETCAYTPNCTQCDVSLTYHKWNNQLKCHYCGYNEQLPKICPSCSASNFSDKGFGTEQIEESLKVLFPGHLSKRMDYDTTRGKHAHQKLITDFEQGKIAILVGTQMVTKGLDFDNVALVGILDADSMLHFPDFRSYERAFQLMMQVAGRAGRKGEQGQVLIQTYDEEHEIFKLLKKHDFSTFIKRQAQERKLFNYPPYNRLIGITLKHKNQRKLDETAQHMMQVAGRAGRKGEQGQVLIQTYDEEHEIFKLLKKHDFSTFIKRQAQERKLFNYPPYNRLIGITLKHKNQRKLDETAQQLVVMMRKSFGNRVLGPEYPAISRIRNYYHKNILLKIEQKGSIASAKKILNTIIDNIQHHSDYKAVRFIIDVDPV
ncbi:MAG: hypothetical protein ABR81_01300, partial [Cryomorphaceae bacterium BACL11 MAG-121128-bin16]